jgi:DNA-binding transcriptional ArsR family regulator
MSAGDLAARFSHSWPTTTRHLRVLEAAGLVSADHDGRHRYYHLDRKRLLTTADLWLDPIRSPPKDLS